MRRLFLFLGKEEQHENNRRAFAGSYTKIQDVKDSSSLNDLRVLYLGKKGPVQELMKGMKDLSKEEKPIFGQRLTN